MKKLMLLVTLFVSLACHAQTSNSDSVIANMSRELDTARVYFIQGMKDIRHDALWHLRFGKARELKWFIRQYESDYPYLFDKK